MGTYFASCGPWADTDRLVARPYRAPELLFGARKYDAMACDLWSLGATFAEFFTTLHRRAISDDEDDDVDTEERGDPTKAYLSDELPRAWSPSQWERYSLFDGSRGDIGLAWSIFRIRGSPTPENWPVRLFHRAFYSASFSFSCIHLVRRSLSYRMRTRSTLSTRPASICQRCCLISACHLHRDRPFILLPRSRSRPQLTCYSAFLSTPQTHVSALRGP